MPDIITDNPLATDGFEFVEFTGPNPQMLHEQFLQLGFRIAGHHRSKKVTHYRQGDINFILNAQSDGHAQQFGEQHGNCANAMAFRVKDAAVAIKKAQERGAEVVESKVGPMELSIPAIKGIGGLHIYLVDRYGANSIYDVDFKPVEDAPSADYTGVGLKVIDHLTHNLQRGNLARWAKFYEDIFNFREIRFFDIEGKHTGLFSKAMTSPCGKIRIPLNESRDDHSQIEEFLKRYGGEGIQHIALSTENIYHSVSALKDKGVPFQSTPDTYYEAVNTRVPGHGQDLAKMQEHQILIDGTADDKTGLLLQIFTQDAIGPIFFEIIQRLGNEGFGEGNFQALFESIELDQIRRGVLNVEED